jgi:dTDP-glucose pyrophosphorylase/CBS domain-containing protein
MRQYNDHLILKGSNLKRALELLNELAPDSILFVVDTDDKLIGSLTDGDVRRGLLNNFTLTSLIDDIIQPNPRFITKGENDIQKIISYRENMFRILPVVDADMRVVKVINFRTIKSYLPIDAVIMAGGKGQRLQPLTNFIPKPLLKVGEKPIMEYNLDRLASFGIDDFWVTVKYLGEQIEEYFKDGGNKNIKIEYVWEKTPLGTIGSVSNITNFEHDYILVVNSDLLTTIDYENFFLDFIKRKADLSVLTIPYQVSIPYAVLETKEGDIISLKEKPTYNYFSNGGVYLMKREVLKNIPKNVLFNSTDLIESLIVKQYKVISYPFSGYWLDVGKHEDFEKAQVDINNLNF